MFGPFEAWNARPEQIGKLRWCLSYRDQLSEEMIESSLASAASFNRSALLMYLDLLAGANLALAFLA